MDGRLTRTNYDEAGDYAVLNVLSPRDLVSRPDNMDETVLSSSATTNFQVRGCYTCWKSTVFTFFYRKVYVTKSDLAKNQAKVNPGSSFEHATCMMGCSPRCYMLSFVAIIGSGAEDVWRDFIIYGLDGHLGRVTKMPNNLLFPLPKGLHINFGFDWQSGFREEDLLNGWRTIKVWLIGVKRFSCSYIMTRSP